MKLILSKFDLKKKVIIIHALPNQNLSDEILDNLEKFYDKYYEKEEQEEIVELDIGAYLSYIFRVNSAWSPENEEVIMLTLYFEEHENTNLLKKEVKSAVLKLREITNFSKILYINTPHVDTESYKLYGRVINILTDCFFEVNKLHATYNLGLAEVLILGDKGSGKTSIVDYLIHGKFVPQTTPTLTPRIYDLLYKEIDFRVLDVCCEEHIKEVFEEHPLERGKLPQAIVYVVDASLNQDSTELSVNEFNEWMFYLSKKYPQGIFKEIPILLLFNKIDLNPDFNLEEYKELYEPKNLELNVRYSTSSAKTGNGLPENFSWVVKRIKVTESY